MATVIIQRALEALIEADARRPPGQVAKTAVVGDEIADIDALPVVREFAPLKTAAAICPDHRLGERQEGIGRPTADIEREARGVTAPRRAQERLDRVVDVEQLPALFAAPDLESLTFARPA